MKRATTNTKPLKRVEPPIREEERKRLQVAMDFLTENWRKAAGMRLGELARIASYSAFHFHRRFRLCFGKTPKEAVTERQIEEAKRLILAGKVLLVEIAAECGFAHQSHLTQRFKQIVGLPPLRWKRGQEKV